MDFIKARNFHLNEHISLPTLADILIDWTINMIRKAAKYYKDCAEIFFLECNVKTVNGKVQGRM